MIGQRQAEAAVDLGFVGRVGLVERLHDGTHLGYEACDFLLGHAPTRLGLLAEPRLGESASGLGLFHPGCDDDRVGAGFEGGAVSVASSGFVVVVLAKGHQLDVGLVLEGHNDRGFLRFSRAGLTVEEVSGNMKNHRLN